MFIIAQRLFNNQELDVFHPCLVQNFGKMSDT